MAIGERFRSGGTRGIARFLADHQHCDEGFDVRREDEPGSGKLKITCEGCGETVSYRAADAVDLAAGGLGADLPANGGGELKAPAPKPQPQPRVHATPPASSPGLSPWAPAPPRSGWRFAGMRPPSWVPALLIGALIVGGLGMIVAGLSRSDDETDAAPTTTAEQAPSEPAAEPAPAAETPDQQGEQNDEGAAQQPGVAEVELDRTRVADTFAIGIPKGWERGETDGGISIAPDGRTAEVRIFFESGERPNSGLARAAAGFLADEHEGAQISAPETIRVGGERAAMIHSTYGGGEEDAVVLSDRGFAFLLTSRVDRGASEQIEKEAAAIIASFQAD